MGKVQIKGTYYQGLHEAIVKEDDWYSAAALLTHNKELSKRSYTYKTTKGYSTDHLLTGLLFCGDCGARMYARQVSKKTQKYICHSVARTSPAMIKSDHCTNRLHPFTVEELDTIIINEIMKLSLNQAYFDDIISEMQAEQKDNDLTLDILKEKMDDIDKQIDRLLNLYQTGLIDFSDIQTRIGKLQKERKLIETQLDNEKEEPQTNIENIWKIFSSFSNVLENGSAEDLHNIIHTLIDKIVVLNEDITIYWSFN
jgi:site-specific DNA recombinase